MKSNTIKILIFCESFAVLEAHNLEIDNNHLVTRYYDLQAKNNQYFAAVERYVNDQVEKLYQDLATTFTDTIVFSIEDAIAAAEKAGFNIDPAEEEIAVTNFMLKDIDALGLWIQPLEESDANTILAKLNFGNHSRYY